MDVGAASGPVRRRESPFDLIGNGIGDDRLQGQGVAGVALVIRSPKMSLVVHLDELRADAYAVTFPAHAAFQHVVHTQLASDLMHVLVSCFVLHRGSSRDYPETLRISAPELRDHLFGQTVAQVLLAGIAAQVQKRKDGEHNFPSGGASARGKLPTKKIAN